MAGAQLTSSPPDNQDQTGGAVQAIAGLSDPEWLALAREAHTASTSYFDTAVRAQVVNDLRQFQGVHPQGSKYLSDAYRARSKFFRPKTRAAVRKNEAIAAEAFFQSQDVVNVTAHDDDDPAQLASAEILKALLQYRLTQSIPWFLTCLGAYQDAQVQGVVCSYQYWEFNAAKKVDRPCVKLCPIENVRFDPSADWADPVNSSPYFIHMIPMYVKDVQARMKTLDPKTGAPKWRMVSDAELLKASTQYSEIVRLQREQGRVDPNSTRTAISAFSVVWIHRNILEIEGVDYVYHTLGTVELLDTPRPLDSVYFHGRRPYVVGYSVLETHKNYPAGPVRLTRDIQSELNENANQRSDNVKFAMNKRYFVKRTAQVDLRSLNRNVPGSVTMLMDPEKDVKVVDTKDVTRSAYQEQDRLNLDFDDLAGSFSQASVQSNRQLHETVGGMNILTKDASQITGYQLRTFVETWVEPVLRQVVLLEQAYEDDPAVLALAGKKANLFQRFGVNAITDELLAHQVTVNVNVGIGATNPHDQLQNFLLALRSLKEFLEDGALVALGMDVQEVMHEIFGKLGYKDGARFFPANQDPTVQALMGQVRQLQQALQAKQPPEIVAATVKKLLAEASKINRDAIKAGVEGMFSAVQTGEVITAVPQVAPVADQVLRASGYVPTEPPGVDPNLPQPGAQGTQQIKAVVNPHIGVGFTPGAASSGAAQNSHPNLPPLPAKPATPGIGARRGIETMRSDSVP